MNENTLGFKISCEPDIKLNEDGTMTTIVDKIVCGRVKSANELIIEQVREIMKENGITELYAIDESKVLQLIQEHKALEIIKKYPRCSLQRYIGFNDMVKSGYELTQEHLFNNDMPCSVEEYNIVIEVLL